MYLMDRAKDTFILVQSDWSVRKAKDLLRRLDVTHVIIHAPEDKRYYLHTKARVQNLLSGSDRQAQIREALNLTGTEAVPVLDAYSNASAAPERAVVTDEENVIGFIDGRYKSTRGGTKGTVTRGSSFRGIDKRGGTAARSTGRSRPTIHTVIAEFQDRVTLNETVSLLISIKKGKVTGSGTLPFTAKPGTTIDIVVQVRRGFSVEGTSEGQITITDQKETLPLQFKMRATELGVGKIRILAFHEGQPLGDILVAATVIPEGTREDSSPSRQSGSIQEVTVNQPDLSILIFEHQKQGLPAFTIRLHSADGRQNLKAFGPVPLGMKPSAYFDDLFQDIKVLPLKTAQDRDFTKNRLKSIGSTLFERLMPEDLQVLLWSLRDHITTIQVQSEEPWIPWELCRLSGRENGKIVEGPFLCEKYEITRWMMGIERKPRLSLKNIGVVVPDASDLPDTKKEKDLLLAMATPERKISSVSPKFADVLEAFASGQYDGWHFSGHSGYHDPDPDQATIRLENELRMIPMDLSGRVANVGASRPFVFFNSCKSVRTDSSLTGIGGWAAKFIYSGAAGFMGSYWSVRDRPALDFCQAFYDRLFSGMPVGKAVKEARGAIKNSGDPTWLAYTVYADPMAKVT